MGHHLIREKLCHAKNDTCHKCGKVGHWAVACRSSPSTSEHPTSSVNAAVLLCAVAGSATRESYYASVTINRQTVLKALIDPGSTDSFITKRLVQNLRVPIAKCPSTTQLADGKVVSIDGEAPLHLRLRDEEYHTQVKVADSLVADMIIGNDILGNHESVEFLPGGSRPKITFGQSNKLCATRIETCFPTMKCDPPSIFSDSLVANARPIVTKSRRSSPESKLFMQEEVQRLIGLGIIEEAHSPWRAQAFVVKGRKPRMVIDYSQTINTFTEVDAYPFPNIEDLLLKASENCYFSKLDLKSAYHQVPLLSKDRPLTAFEVDGRLYQFTRLPFGVTNAVPAFQRIMDKFVQSNQLNGALPYLDDVIIGGKTQAEHDKNLSEFMAAAKCADLTINNSKCVFNVKQISFLGHIIENGSKKPDPERLQALTDFPCPQTACQLRRLLGFFAYNAKWVNDYSNKINPILEAMQAKALPLSPRVLNAIQAIKTDIASACLASPRKDLGHLLLETDASGTAIGAVLSQADRPIAYFSRTLSAGEQKQSTVEREAMAIVESCRKWGHFIKAIHTVVKTDQQSVSFMFAKNKSRIKNDKITRWRLELSEYDYEIHYRSGSENVPADALSRVAAVTADKPIHDLVSIHNCLAHPGVTRLYEYVQRHHLPFSVEEVRSVIAKCSTCLDCKPRFFKPAEPAKLVKATQPFERLGVDLIGPKTPSSAKNRFVLTIIDEYSRFPFAYPLREITSRALIACFKHLFAIFGCPGSIHSDRGSQFISSEFDDFCLKRGIAHSRTTPYNPKGNGQTERYNGVIWKSVQCLLHAQKLSPSMWESVLPEALAANRMLICTVTNEPPHDRLFAYSRRGTKEQSLPEWLSTGKPANLRNFVRNKDDPLVVPVKINQVINPYFARIEWPNGRIDTVSTTALAPSVSTGSDTVSPTIDTGCEESTVTNHEATEALERESTDQGDTRTRAIEEAVISTPSLAEGRARRVTRAPERLIASV